MEKLFIDQFFLRRPYTFHMTILGTDGKKRCFGGQKGKEAYGHYHDYYWGKPCFDDRALFEALVLETLQSGLSFEIILKRKDAFLKCFHDFDINKCARLTDSFLENCSQDPTLLRHKAKLLSIRTNALTVLEIQKQFSSFSHYVWSFVDHRPIVHKMCSFDEALKYETLGAKLYQDLKKRGAKFIGPKTVYAFMQATGLVDDHLNSCHLRSL
jgi:DNA-3-methyladenine glycosylase I